MAKSISAARQAMKTSSKALTQSGRITSTRKVLAFACTEHLNDETYRILFYAEPMERVVIVKQGIHPCVVEDLAKQMAMPKEKFLGTLGLARATVERKARENKLLSPDESSKVIGMARLVGQVQAMVEESGDPTDFDAPAWTATWLDRPLPALGGRKPADFMDTAEGQQLVSNLIARMQSGAYA